LIAKRFFEIRIAIASGHVHGAIAEKGIYENHAVDDDPSSLAQDYGVVGELS